MERANGYLETSFLPARSFASPADFNTQLLAWLDRANNRQHRALGCKPVERWDADRSAMLALPPLPPALGWSESVRLPRDYYVRLDSNDYFVHPSVIGRRVEVRADADTVTVTCAGRRVASHTRSWARRQCLTDPDHRSAAEVLRTAQRPPAASMEDVQQRSLADYDLFLASPRTSRDGRRSREYPGARLPSGGRVPDPRAQGAHDARGRHPTGRTRQGRVLVA